METLPIRGGLLLSYSKVQLTQRLYYLLNFLLVISLITMY